MINAKESRYRLIVAWISWWLMLSGVGLFAVYLIVFSSFFVIGGWELVANVLAGTAKNSNESSRIILISLLFGFPVGAWFGIWLWAKLMRKTGFISDDQVRKMSSNNK